MDPSPTVAQRLARVDWSGVQQALGDRPYARLPGLLTPDECASVTRLFAEEGRFRSRVDMERHRFGRGEYKYFARPLPPLVEELRVAAYPPLAAIANAWMRALASDERFPRSLAAFSRRCAAAGQSEPTPLLLRYEAGGYNCLHQDVYGNLAFPLQVAVFLSQPGRDYEGGEFLLVENRPRAQSVGEAVVLGQGEALVFPNRVRPLPSARGHSRGQVRHGVSRLHRGTRYTLGLIFHDAR